MSLIRVRRERRELGSGEPRRPKLWRLILAAIFVAFVFYLLSKY